MGELPIDLNMASLEDPRHPRMPNPTSTLSWWRTQPHPLDEFISSNVVPEIVDIAIIGAGMAGACTAYHLLSGGNADESRPSVAIFEARQACSGATGRNGGHARISLVYLTEFVDKHGPAAALELALFLKQLLREMKACAEALSVSNQEDSSRRTLAEECEMLATRSWDVFQDESQAIDMEKAWGKAMKSLQDFAKQEGREDDIDWLGEVQFVKGAHVENVSARINISSTPQNRG